MDELIKQFIFTRFTPPKHVKELLEFLEEIYQQGNITPFEYGKLVDLLHDYGI